MPDLSSLYSALRLGFAVTGDECDSLELPQGGTVSSADLAERLSEKPFVFDKLKCHHMAA